MQQPNADVIPTADSETETNTAPVDTLDERSVPAEEQHAPNAEFSDEAPILIIKPNIRGCWPEIILATSLILVAYFLKGMLVQGYGDFVTTATTEQIATFSSAVNKYGFWLTILTFITLYVRILFVQHNEKLFLGKTYVEAHRGIIARKRTRINLDHIRTVDVNQGVIDRLLKIGTIEMASAGTSESELVVGRILDPIRVRDIVRKQQGLKQS